ncbi:MAG: hypothetical protein CMA08_04400 [Euryarchaeota archaeon]|nr:hypothetical protein [Euryarchaeota archaeon]OUX21416.1 MAG: hypothetical protein CBE12_04340 [Euryarchaeota archaeon TMED252]
MAYTIGLQGYEVHAVHGWFDHELENTQPFVGDVTVVTGSAGATQLDATVNYADLQSAVDAVLLESDQPYRLLEAMVDAILDRLMTTPGVAKATVRIAKPEAPLPHPGGCPWVEASRAAEAEP